MNCYNSAETLSEALQSVMAQTFTDWEIIFYDNGSDDESLGIAKSFAKKSEKILIFQNAERISLGHSRNGAMAKASGKYIAFLDCDDIWLPTKLEKQVKLLQENSNVALVCSDAENFYIKNNKYKSLSRMFATATPHRGKVFKKLIMGQWITMSSVLLRRDCLQKKEDRYFDNALNICEEADFFYALAHVHDFDYVDEVLTKRRIHHKNITFTRFDDLAAETEYILKKQHELYADFHIKYAEIVQILNERAAFQKSIAHWRNGKPRAARTCLAKCRTLKAKLFYMVSFMPPVLFPHCAKIYLRFAKYLR